jgi:hypothetical protein
MKQEAGMNAKSQKICIFASPIVENCFDSTAGGKCKTVVIGIIPVVVESPQ